MTTRATIDDFLVPGCHIAFVGASRDPKQFSSTVYRELRDHGYDLTPVNPAADEIAGDRCCRSIGLLPSVVDRAIVMVASATSAAVVQELIDHGIRRIWLHKGVGPSSVSAEAVALCEANGVALVAGACPLMFVAPMGWPHRVHRLERKLIGRLPA